MFSVKVVKRDLCIMFQTQNCDVKDKMKTLPHGFWRKRSAQTENRATGVLAFRVGNLSVSSFVINKASSSWFSSSSSLRFISLERLQMFQELLGLLPVAVRCELVLHLLERLQQVSSFWMNLCCRSCWPVQEESQQDRSCWRLQEQETTARGHHATHHAPIITVNVLQRLQSQHGEKRPCAALTLEELGDEATVRSV